MHFAHLDTTTVSLQGEYDVEQNVAVAEPDEEQVITITYGHIWYGHIWHSSRKMTKRRF